ncbi:MAG: PorV/PorQ family protein [Gemmatimonadetes bacterium]|nr:PorV/PorQ family protein [Gemmatimonadota bacterium]
MNSRIQTAALAVTLLMIGLAPGRAFAQSDFGEERVGTNMGSFLKIGIGGKAVALGEAFIAVADDPSTIFWNPAGLSNLSEREIYFSHTAWVADIDYEYVAYVQPTPQFMNTTVGFHIGTLRTDLLETTEEQPTGTGRGFTYSDLFVGVAASRQFTNKLAIGFGVKYIREDHGGSIGAPSVDTWSADFGTFYRLGVRNAIFSVTLTNFGPDWKPDGTFTEVTSAGFEIEREYESFSTPTSFKAGLSSILWQQHDFKHLATVEMNRPPDNAETYRVATELTYMEMLALRTGYNLNADELKWSGGLGVILRTGGIGQRVDYAFTQTEHLGRIDRISAGIRF